MIFPSVLSYFISFLTFLTYSSYYVFWILPLWTFSFCPPFSYVYPIYSCAHSNRSSFSRGFHTFLLCFSFYSFLCPLFSFLPFFMAKTHLRSILLFASVCLLPFIIPPFLSPTLLLGSASLSALQALSRRMTSVKCISNGIPYRCTCKMVISLPHFTPSKKEIKPEQPVLESFQTLPHERDVAWAGNAMMVILCEEHILSSQPCGVTTPTVIIPLHQGWESHCLSFLCEREVVSFKQPYLPIFTRLGGNPQGPDFSYCFILSPYEVPF